MNNYSEDFISKIVNEAYQSGNPDFEVIPENSAILVIDMQDEFVLPGWTPYWVPEATKQIPKIKTLIYFCRSKNIPVIYTVFRKTHLYFDRPGSGKLMPNRYTKFVEDNPEWFKEGKITDDLKPEKNDIVIYKPSYGAFYDTPLETILKNLKRDTIIICGTLTNYCCGTTARQGYERGFKVIFGSDINATDDVSMQEPELKTLRKGFAMVLSCEEIIQKLGKK